MTYLITGLVFSILLNILFAWYLYKVLAKLLYTSDNIGDLYAAFRMYEKFIKSIYEMDMFYGEPILMELVDKTRLILEEIERFEEIYVLTTDIEAIEEDFENDTTTEEDDA
jgi:hypothetical protein